MAGKFASRLGRLGLVVKELTGDMQLSRTEIADTHMLVVTPEKWDVITRKSSDAALTAMVRCPLQALYKTHAHAGGHAREVGRDHAQELGRRPHRHGALSFTGSL